MAWLRLGATVLVLLLATAVIAFLYGSSSWRHATAALVAQLDAGAKPCGAAIYHAADVDNLPPPVVRFFQSTLKDGQPIVKHVRIAHGGEFNASDTAATWSPFSSMQTYRVNPPGFVWDARVSMMPVVPALVRDRYLDRQGGVHAAIGGLLTVARAEGTSAMAVSALQRYLAEAMWFPTALLPACGVMWEPLDDRRALATISDPPWTASLEFHFNDRNDIADVFTPARYRMVGNDAVLTPWRGINSAWAMHNGMRIPIESEVRWELKDRMLPYWRARIIDIAYD
jgi:hypothetical protein